jgi:ABC-type enterobactin transport system permease subunit
VCVDTLPTLYAVYKPTNLKPLLAAVRALSKPVTTVTTCAGGPASPVRLTAPAMARVLIATTSTSPTASNASSKCVDALSSFLSYHRALLWMAGEQHPTLLVR